MGAPRRFFRRGGGYRGTRGTGGPPRRPYQDESQVIIGIFISSTRIFVVSIFYYFLINKMHLFLSYINKNLKKLKF